MSNAPEEVGKVATSAIDALKNSPGLLVLVFLQLATLGILYFANQRNMDRTHEREMSLLDHCYPKQGPSGRISFLADDSWRDWWMADLEKEIANEN